MAGPIGPAWRTHMATINFGVNTSQICTRKEDGISLWRTKAGAWFLDAKWTLGENLLDRAQKSVDPISPADALEFLLENGAELCIPRYFPGEILLTVRPVPLADGKWTWVIDTDIQRALRTTTEVFLTEQLAADAGQDFLTFLS